jgi:pre-mRNA-splicing factor CDC5/CEF1
VASVGETPRDQRIRVSASKRALQAGFMNLPKPENNFELVVPDEEEGADEGDVEGGESVEDAAQRDARIKKRKEEEERRELARRSEVIKRGLPRPANVDVSGLFEQLNLVDYDGDEGEDETRDADRLLNTELVQLVEHDSIVYPLPGTTRPGSAAVSTYTPPDDDSLEEASNEIHQEMAKLLGFPTASPSQVKEGLMKLAKAEADGEGGLRPEDWEESWACIKKRLVYDVKMNKWVEPSELSETERVEGYGYVLERKRESMSKESAKLAKVEKKLGIILGGYQHVGHSLSQRVESGFEKLRQTSIELDVFKRLKEGEVIVGQRRVSALEEEVEGLEVKERMGQSRYEELGRIREEAVGRIAELEERVMEFAETVNEERLGEMQGVV